MGRPESAPADDTDGPSGPLAELRALRDAGELEPDQAQLLAAEKLQGLYHALRGYRPVRHDSWKARLGLQGRTEEPPQGLYIYGDVGRGKSMLMDLFFDTAAIGRKRRVHFHEFMLEVHETLHDWRQGGEGGRRVDDMIASLSEKIAGDAWLLCFDELHVGNIADAIILGRLFEGMLARGVVIVATSNWHPDDLYRDGLQRELFLPFIAMIKRRLDLLHLQSPRDYRLARLLGTRVYHMPPGPAAERALARAFADLTDGATGTPETVVVQGRSVTVPRAARNVAWFTFADLCERPLGAADYLAVARRYATVLLSGVPRMGPHQRNEAKRFATLVDALYQRGVRLVCSAEAAPQDLYTEGTGAVDFRRTVSRLMEMQSEEYVAGRT